MASQLYKGLDPLATTAPPVVNNLTSTSTTSALSAYQGKVLKDIIDGLIYKKTLTHSYTVAGNNQVHWNPTEDTGFNVSGYTPIGIVGIITNNVNVVPFHFRVENSDWAMALRNVSSTEVSTICIYEVLYIKTLS